LGRSDNLEERGRERARRPLSTVRFDSQIDREECN
jgi:hypothetical protein